MSYNYSPHESYLWTKRSGFYLDAKALRLVYRIEYLESVLRNLRHRLYVNTRHLEKIDFYSTKANLDWFRSLRRRLNEKFDHKKQRGRQIYQIRMRLLEVQILVDREAIASKEATLARLREEFEPRIQWESKEAQQNYLKWLCDEEIRQEEKNYRKIKRKRRDRERWEGKWQKFLLSKKSKKKGFAGHSDLWGSFLF